MSKITYSDKSDISTSSVAATNKIVAADMNEIKSVVNTNDTLMGDLTTLDTTIKSSIVGALNEVNTKASLESGTGYIKFDDGTMICYGSKSGTSSLADYWTDMKKTGAITIDFPQSFSSNPYVNLIPHENGAISTILANSYPTTTQCQFFVIKMKGTTDTTYNVHYIAIGKWKE